jgi:TrmH family RNA methyltransferase
VFELSARAVERIGDTVTPQPVFAVVSMPPPLDASSLAEADLTVIGALISDPGNAGTLMRSGAAAGARVIGLGAGSVDAYNPKAVRASAGACFAIRIVEGVPPVQMLEVIGDRGMRRLGATAAGGRPPEAFDLTEPTAFVVGHETHGLATDLPLDALVSIPMATGESINVAMAAAVLCFEAARQRRERP